MKAALLFLALSPPLTALAGGLSAAAQKEIPYLFSVLEASGCEFYRNGTWNDSHAASTHLKKKYQYRLDKGLLSSTESFIELAATKSSVNSLPYQVRCGTAAPVDSAAWFNAELAKYRNSAADQTHP